MSVSGVAVIGALLRADEALVAIVPEERIKAAALPDDVELPAIVVRCISSVEQHFLKRGATTPTRDRVSVTVRAANYRDQVAIIRLIKQSCAGFAGAQIGDETVSILTAGTGPDVRGPANSFEQAQDFMVSYDA